MTLDVNFPRDVAGLLYRGRNFAMSKLTTKEIARRLELNESFLRSRFSRRGIQLKLLMRAFRVRWVEEKRRTEHKTLVAALAETKWWRNQGGYSLSRQGVRGTLEWELAGLYLHCEMTPQIAKRAERMILEWNGTAGRKPPKRSQRSAGDGAVGSSPGS